MLGNLRPGLSESRVARARQAVGKKTAYKLGKGGFNPAATLPGQLNPNTQRFECDCSGLVAWVLGLSRRPKTSRPFWIETTAIFRDARSGRGNSTFVQLAKPVPGCIVVYGDRGKSQGHTGIVTEVRADGSFIGIDCSSGQSRRTGDAITERDLTWFRTHGGIFVTLRQDLA